MQCPYCHSNIAEGVKICPVCHGDVEAGLRRAQQSRAQAEWDRTVAMPVQRTQQQTQSQQVQSQQTRQNQYQQAYPQGVSYGSQNNQAYTQAAQTNQQGSQAQDQAYGRQGSYPQYDPQYDGYAQTDYQQQANQQANQYQQPVNRAYQNASSVSGGVQNGFAQGNVRPFDTKSMNSAPKWPIVLIVILIILIAVAAILLVTKPWASSETSTTTPAQTSQASDASQATSAVAAATDTGATDTQATVEPAQGDGTQATATDATATATDDATLYALLNDAYNALSGYDSSISNIATQFNQDLLYQGLDARQAALDNARSLQSQIDSELATLNATVASAGSAYADTLAAITNLYNDLSHRIGVLVSALETSVSEGADDPSAAINDIAAILEADNGADGINIYKADYDANYAAAVPVAPAA